MSLTQKSAQYRHQFIKQGSLAYRFCISLHSGKTYEGLTQISFSLLQVPQQLFIDCKAKQVKTLKINGVIENEIKHEDGKIFLDCAKLKVDENKVIIAYKSQYNNDGDGLVSFVDTSDGDKQYLYTTFEPYHAHKVFPCFDQPDLKATMILSIIAQPDWLILSNEQSTQQAPNNAEYFKNSHPDVLQKCPISWEGNLTLFPQTKLLPTYLYCFIAGPYIRIKIEQEYKGIPMSLYCLKSLEEHLWKIKDFIFEVTIESMKFFESFFGVPYSFNKYDQVFAHQYNSGAMENAGIVTFRDDYIFKGEVSTEEMLELANTISHELSHHWFGNLSTMKWWDDLWLNESFADFISYFCLEEIKNNMKTIKYDSSLTAFMTRKAWGYATDQFRTTHPIRGEVQNTVIAESIFDGITYAKGASTMQQLLFLMGKQNFSAGLKKYFTKYAFKNATLGQFMAELQTHYQNPHLSLEQWKTYWLETPSFNVLTPVWNIQAKSNCEKLTVQNKPLKQQFSTIRPHKINIALFRQDCSFDVMQVFIMKDQPSTTFEYNGSKEYKAVLLNYGDQTFARIVIDEESKKFFRKNVNKIDDVLTRALIWKSFYDDVYCGDASSKQFIQIFTELIEKEKSDSVFQTQFQKVYNAINIFTPRCYREELNAKLFHFTLILKEKVDSSLKNRHIVIRQKLVDFAFGNPLLEVMIPWLNGKTEEMNDLKNVLKTGELTVPQQWTIVVRAFSNTKISPQQKEKMLEKQLKKDSSDEGKLQKAICDSLKANKQEFQEIYASFKDPKNEKSKAFKEYQALGWNHPYNFELLKEFKKQYFSDVVEVSTVLEGEHYYFFLNRLLPVDDNLQETIEGLKGIKLGDQDKFAKAKKDISNHIDRLERRKRAYQRFQTQK